MKSSNMRQIVYVITTNGLDYYSAMTRVSVSSIRITNPRMMVSIVTDEQSARLMEQKSDPLLKEIDDFIVQDAKGNHPVFINRYLKTSLRQRVSGPFVFSDSDTLYRGDLTPVFDSDADIAAARNHSTGNRSLQIWSGDWDVLRQMNWQIRKDIYFNAGVTYYNESEGASKFCETYHTLYMDYVTKTGQYRDQPSFNAAIYRSGVNICQLPDQYNAQFTIENRAQINADVWHYYSSIDQPVKTGFEKMVNDILFGEPLETEKIKGLIQYPFPWTRQSILDEWYHAYLSKKPIRNFSDDFWLTGQRLKALTSKIINVGFRFRKKNSL